MELASFSPKIKLNLYIYYGKTNFCICFCLITDKDPIAESKLVGIMTNSGLN